MCKICSRRGGTIEIILKRKTNSRFFIERQSDRISYPSQVVGQNTSMKFDASISKNDREKILKSLDDIKKYGDTMQRLTAEFIEQSAIPIFVGSAEKVGGSGSVFIDKVVQAQWAIYRGELSALDAAKFIRLSIARETIDTGGQRGIEGTLVHEGKHALDFARMIASFSGGNENRYFDPTAFQREYSAHLTAAFYLMRRGGEYAGEGIDLGLLYQNNGKTSINRKGIRARLKNNYGLTPDTPGKRLSKLSFPHIVPRDWRFWKLFNN
jgi:hypothetical protein